MSANSFGEAVVLWVSLVGIGLWILVMARMLRRIPILKPGPRNRISWGPSAAIAVLLVSILAQVAVFLVAKALGFIPKEVLAEQFSVARLKALYILYLAANTLTLTLILMLVFPSGGLRSLGLGKGMWADALRLGAQAECMAYPLLAIVWEVSQKAAEAFGYSWEKPETARMMEVLKGARPLDVILILATVSLAVPFFEEVIFRGFFQQGIRGTFGPRTAIVLSALVFAFLHEVPYSTPGIFVLALFLGYLYEKTQSLGPPFLLHGLHNLLTSILVLFGTN